ncbi:hypothetical protein HY633_02675 [Candidatus Uhrbacteria bacterium]|nr:hypothetical protein [Candidatus Uhrbacteria bacterium]
MAFASAICLGCGYLIRPTEPQLAQKILPAGSLLLLLAALQYALTVFVDDIAKPAITTIHALKFRFGPRDPAEMRATAYHEAGHALVAWFSPGAPLPKNATIVRCIEHLGEVKFEEQPLEDRGALLADIRVSLAGSAAEELCIGDFTSGSRDDFGDATTTATNMVAVYGMSEALGPQTFNIDDIPGLEPEIRRKIRKNVRKILDGEKKAARALLERHRPLLDALAAELMRKKTLRRKQLAAILGERPAPTARTPLQRQLAAVKIS